MKTIKPLKVLIIGTVISFLPSYVVGNDPESPNFDDDPIIDGLPAGLQPWRDPDNPDVIKLDKGYDDFFIRTERSEEKREPGPINLQRY